MELDSPARKPINFPQAIDPETGQPEIIGNGRIVVIGKEGVQRLVTIPVGNGMLDRLVASGELKNN